MPSIEALAAENFDRFVGEFVSYHETSTHLVPVDEITELHIKLMGMYAQAAGHIKDIYDQLSV